MSLVPVPGTPGAGPVKHGLHTLSLPHHHLTLCPLHSPSHLLIILQESGASPHLLHLLLPHPLQIKVALPDLPLIPHLPVQKGPGHNGLSLQRLRFIVRRHLSGHHAHQVLLPVHKPPALQIHPPAALPRLFPKASTPCPSAHPMDPSACHKSKHIGKQHCHRTEPPKSTHKKSPSSSHSMKRGIPLLMIYTSTVILSRCHSSSTYSWMVRSELNLPEQATLSIAAFAHHFLSR